GLRTGAARTVLGLTVAGLCVLAACQQRATRATPTVYQQATRINASGLYRHPSSGMTFPPSIGEFGRVLLVMYAGRSVSARYAIEGATSLIEATVYVYPSATDVPGPGSERCRTQVSLATTDFARSQPSIRL